MVSPLLPVVVSLAGVACAQSIPSNAQVIDQLKSNVQQDVPPVTVANITTYNLPPGLTAQEAKVKPFHIYDPAFLDVIGTKPTLSLIATTESDPVFHEAVVWYPPTEEVFFVQNAGAKAAGTGLNKTNLVQKISLKEAQTFADGTNKTAEAEVVVVDASPPMLNTNGATNFRGKIVFTGEGQGDKAPALYQMSPVAPYNTTVLINNYYGRQFNSLNDVVVHPKNGEIYFTDSLYGYLQDFRPPPGMPTMIYRLNADTGAIQVVADGFDKCNGLTFSPDGTKAYVTDTGAALAYYGWNSSAPSAIYRFDVAEDGTWSNRMTFAYVSVAIPDGVHCDSEGNVYSGVGDGVHVWNSAGTLLGKIYTGIVCANFRFAGDGRMVITGQTELWYATLAAKGADPEGHFVANSTTIG